MIWIFFIILGVLIILMMNSKTYKELSKADAINKNNLYKKLNSLDAKGTRFVSFNNSGAAILDNETKKLHVIFSVDQTFTNIHEYEYVSCNFDDIIESEVVVDENTITKLLEVVN